MTISKRHDRPYMLLLMDTITYINPYNQMLVAFRFRDCYGPPSILRKSTSPWGAVDPQTGGVLAISIRGQRFSPDVIT